MIINPPMVVIEILKGQVAPMELEDLVLIGML